MNSRNGRKLTVVFVAFAMIFAGFSPVEATGEAGEETRFFVQSTGGLTNSIVRSLLVVRHEFADGFTTDAPGLKLGLAKALGAKVYPVQKLNILPAEEAAAVAQDAADPSARGGNPGKPPKEPTPTPTTEPTPEPRPTPDEQVSWGVTMLTGALGGGAGVNVAVLDTGVFTGHPDLTRRVVDCKDFTHRKHAVREDLCDDEHGHGTHVAGTIAADGGEDGLGIVGVAPEANLLAYRVCGKSGSCWSDDIAVAIRTATDNGAHIINLSLGSDTSSSLIEDAVAYATDNGVLVVAAAGNDGPYADSIDYPGALDRVIAVGALDIDRVIAEWSSHGNNEQTEPYVVQERDIEFAAPGVNIESTFNDGGYAILSGTSMAAPHIAGFAAAAWDVTGEEQSVAVRDLLHALSVDLEPAGDDDASGWGMPGL